MKFKKYNYLLTSTNKRDNFKPRKIAHTRMYMTSNDIIHFIVKLSDELKLTYGLLSAYQLFNQNAPILVVKKAFNNNRKLNKKD